ncbi:hypothetical protein [Streptacidiphilus cavernicola]|uniref:Nucleoside diphosphate kinase-like domain-containing protein n=1 Tax=Streptacidiphilus cavernicola TaxID=3342716 RepID=A0ABV6VVP9_9ACTN
MSTAPLHDIPPHVLPAVTRSPAKAALYGVDNYFREGCWTFAEQLDDVLGVTLCVLKPEAAAGRRYQVALRALRDNGFHPVDVLRFRHDRLTIRETWRYQFNFAAHERMDAMDLVLPTIDSVLLVVRDEQWAPGRTPASVRLTDLKGPSAPELRRPEHLRQRLGAVNGLFNFMHTSDEPIDVIRELSVLTGSERREAVRERIRAGHDALAEAEAAFAELEAGTPEHDLDLERSWERLTGSTAPVGELARIRAKGGEVPLADVMAAARSPFAEPADHWDLLSVITHTIEFNTPGIGRIFPNVMFSAWQEDPDGGAA